MGHIDPKYQLTLGAAHVCVVLETVPEKFVCRDCGTITQPPAPFHPIARGRAGPNLLAMILFNKFGLRQPLNRQSETYAAEGVSLIVSTLADYVGHCSLFLRRLVELIEAHILAGGRIHHDDTTVPVIAAGKTITGRIWTSVRDDRPFGGSDHCRYLRQRWRPGHRSRHPQTLALAQASVRRRCL